MKGRKFYDFALPEAQSTERSARGPNLDLINGIQQDLKEHLTTFVGPFGRRPIIHADHIASGQSLGFVESIIQRQVLPFYGNTHTSTSVTSLQTSMFRHEARDTIRNACHASEEDAVIFAGHGCTGAVHKLIDALDLPRQKQPVTVFVSGMEHHSNLLPWRDLGAQMVYIPEDAEGQIDHNALRSALEAHENSSTLLIGCFCAASNVTGILNDDLAITALLHQHGALAFWDYATAAPYLEVNMNPKVPFDVDNLCYKDAVYFSLHKFMGGVQTPGVLIAKKKLFVSDKPNGAGGGSVFFVKGNGHRYLKDPEVREEGGTPAIVQSIRGGIVMKLKDTVTTGYIIQRELDLKKKAFQRLESMNNFALLGSRSQPRLAVISFMIRHGDGYLHHNFVASLLNDVFGIQCRGGCACAGPYVQHLLGIDVKLAEAFEEALLEDDRLDRHHLRRGPAEYSTYEILRPGFTRLNLPWTSSEEEIDFILNALAFVSDHGWKLLPLYCMNYESGDWKHHFFSGYSERKWLGDIDFQTYLSPNKKNDPKHVPLSFQDILIEANNLIGSTSKHSLSLQLGDQAIIFDKVKHLRWFLLPSEAQDQLRGNQTQDLKSPFHVLNYINSNVEEVRDVKTIGSFSPSFSPNDELKTILCKTKRASTWLPTKDQTEPHFPIVPSHPQLEVTDTNSSSSNEVMKCSYDLCVLTEKRLPIPELRVKSIWRPPTKDIFKPFLEAVETFKMIRDGDRVLVCLSGGKDSLSLLHAMKQYQYYGKKNGIQFDLGAVTVDPLSSAYDPRPLIPYLEELHVPYLYEEQAIMEQALAANCSSICAFCSRMKRGRIYASARREKYNVLAMGQHLDDLAESFLMSVFHNGRLRTMKAHYTVKEGDLRVIRPFAFVREKQLRIFAETQKLPVIPENCPACFESPKERHRMKQLLAQQEILFPKLYWSLKSAMIPVMNIRKTGLESTIFGRNNFNKKETTDVADSSDEEEC
eukprot:TCALIF_06718-PA protein Name:"Similar to ttcA tRNA 2-thiocytidine biosynthesis protein TtcA (Nitrosococcus oceani (strain ATCC 19707 / NCIMB 11848))" AED:0.00 eAED:0.00 QI:0/0/0/0.5/1/1/2/0/980